MPCSAEIEPPKLEHDLVDGVVDLVPAREECALSAPTGWLTL